jgi:hypothetical protein
MGSGFQTELHRKSDRYEQPALTMELQAPPASIVPRSGELAVPPMAQQLGTQLDLGL